MADADFTAILIHLCTIQRRAAATADELGHTKGDYVDSTVSVACRLETYIGTGRYTERIADAKSLVGGFILMVEPETDIKQGDRITTVVQSSDSSVVNAGPFSVLRVNRADDLEELHHLEAEVDLVSASDR